MKRNKKAVSRKGRVRQSKCIATFCALILVLASILFPYEAQAAIAAPQIQYSIVQTPWFIQDYLTQIEQDGYVIDSWAISLQDAEMRFPLIMTHPSKTIQAILIDNLDVIVSGVQLTFEKTNESYTFKNKEDCETWLKELNAIKKQTNYKITDIKLNYSTITSTEALAQKIANVKNEVTKEKEEQKRKQSITVSRGSSLPRVSSYAFPLKSYAYVSSEYGPRWGTTHTGIDFAAKAGTHIYSWRDGKVTFAGWSGGYGNFIIIDHGNGFVTRYAHCSKIAVTKGQTVSQGQIIGYVGTTGNSTGNHLHFEIKVNGRFVNPRNYLSI